MVDSSVQHSSRQNSNREGWRYLDCHSPTEGNFNALLVKTWGFQVVDGESTRRQVTLTTQDRMRHVVVLGKTGSGKSYLLRHMIEQDIEKDRGLILQGGPRTLASRRFAGQYLLYWNLVSPPQAQRG